MAEGLLEEKLLDCEAHLKGQMANQEMTAAMSQLGETQAIFQLQL